MKFRKHCSRTSLPMKPVEPVKMIFISKKFGIDNIKQYIFDQDAERQMFVARYLCCPAFPGSGGDSSRYATPQSSVLVLLDREEFDGNGH